MAELLYAREVYGKTLVELGKKRQDIVVLDSDLSCSTKTAFFAREFPERFFNFGVAEQNMMATAAGLASCSKVVFASTFAIFATGRAWDQVRNTVSYNNFNVKIVATHAGITVGPDGASHQALEDIALMRLIPSMHIVVPADGPETRDALIHAASCPGPFYIRLGRAKTETLKNKKPYSFGKAYSLTEGKDVAIIACGMMVGEALKVEKALRKEGIACRVINMHTLRPMDTKTVIKAARETKGIVVCEEHSVIGGLASSIDEIVTENSPTKVMRIGVRSRFGQSGQPKDLLKEYNLTTDDIIKAVKGLL